MAKAKRLKPRKRWTNRLAWSVWKIARNNKIRAGAVVKEVCRWFSNFNGTSSYAEMTDVITPSGSFEAMMDVNISDLTGWNDALGSEGIGMVSVGVNNGELRATRIATTDLPASGLFISADTNHTISFIFVENAGVYSIQYKLDGVLSAVFPSVNLNLSQIAFEVIGRRNAGQWFNGQLSNLQIWENGDSTTGTKIMNMAMDERYLNVHGEILYNNSAVVDDWYLSLIIDAPVSVKEVVLSGEFDFELDLSQVQASDTAILFGSSTGSTPAILLTGGECRVRLDSGASFQTGSLSIVDDERYILRVVRDDLDFIKVYINNVIFETSLSALSGDMTLSLLFNYSSAQFPLMGNVYGVRFWNDGDRNTGTKVLDYKFDSLSNVIVNQATTPSANLWDGSTAVATGESSVIDTETINVLSTGVNSQVSVAETVAGQDVLVQVTVESGDLNNIICGDLTTEFTGWTNILDSFKQPIPKRFQTLTNNDLDFIVFKTNGVADVTLTNITAQTVDSYGVLNGTRNTDYKYKNDSPHAIGCNITTTEDPDCPLSDLFAGGVLQSNGTLQDGTILGQP